MSRDDLRRTVAFFGHAPGLWLCFGERPSLELRRANRWAILATATAMYAAATLSRPPRKTAHIGLAWLAGHIAWGAYLASRLPPPKSTAQ